MPHSVFSSIPTGLDTLDAVAPSTPVMTTKNDFKHCQLFPGGGERGVKLPPVENYWFRVKRDYCNREAQRELLTAEVTFESSLVAG